MSGPTEEQLARQVAVRTPPSDHYLKFFELTRYDQERLRMLFWAALPASVDGVAALDRLNRMAGRFRIAGLRGEALLERMADAIVRRWPSEAATDGQEKPQ